MGDREKMKMREQMEASAKSPDPIVQALDEQVGACSCKT